jgi:hypothetical protein
MTQRRPKNLTLKDAIERLHHKDSRLAKMHTSTGPQWFILPEGGAVRDQDAEKILARTDIKGQQDALFPGLDQTFRMVR